MGCRSSSWGGSDDNREPSAAGPQRPLVDSRGNQGVGGEGGPGSGERHLVFGVRSCAAPDPRPAPSKDVPQIRDDVVARRIQDGDEALVTQQDSLAVRTPSQGDEGSERSRAKVDPIARRAWKRSHLQLRLEAHEPPELPRPKEELEVRACRPAQTTDGTVGRDEASRVRPFGVGPALGAFRRVGVCGHGRKRWMVNRAIACGSCRSGRLGKPRVYVRALQPCSGRPRRQGDWAAGVARTSPIAPSGSWARHAVWREGAIGPRDAPERLERGPPRRLPSQEAQAPPGRSAIHPH